MTENIFSKIYYDLNKLPLKKVDHKKKVYSIHIFYGRKKEVAVL